MKNNICSRLEDNIKTTKSIYIVCEGKNSEPIYLREYINLLVRKINEKQINNFAIIDPGVDFQKFKITIPCTDNNGNELERIEINIKHIDKTDPINIINNGREQAKENNYVFCIFDKDGHVDGRKERYNEAIKTKVEENVKKINSVPFFEYFIRLHFEYNTSEEYCNGPSDNFIKNILNKRLHLKYTKKTRDFYIFFKKNLKDKIMTAIKNSQKLKNENLSEPITNFHILLIELFKIITEKIEDNNYKTKNKNNDEILKIMEKILK